MRTQIIVKRKDDELCHWKYIKREKKAGGGYQYYYKDDKHDRLRKSYWKVDDDYQLAQDTFRSKVEFIDYYQAQLDKKNGGDVQKTDANKNLQQWKKERDEAADKAAEAYRKKERYRKAYENYSKKYEKSFGHKVADFLTNSSSEINKGKKWIKNLFK